MRAEYYGINSQEINYLSMEYRFIQSVVSSILNKSYFWLCFPVTAKNIGKVQQLNLVLKFVPSAKQGLIIDLFVTSMWVGLAKHRTYLMHIIIEAVFSCANMFDTFPWRNGTNP